MEKIELANRAFDEFCTQNDKNKSIAAITEKYWFINGYLARMEEEKIEVLRPKVLPENIEDYMIEIEKEVCVFES